MSGSRLHGPVPLGPDHRCDDFDSGVAELDDWLRRFAAGNQRAEYTQTYVVTRDDRVVGFHALAAGNVHPTGAPSRVRAGLPHAQPIPVVILARLAVDRSEQGAGLGRALLKDALIRFLAAADIIGARALLVDAQNEAARAFYARFGFEPSPVDPLQMLLLTKDVRTAVAG